MVLKRFIRTKVQIDEPVISFGDKRFQYSAVFSKIAELNKYTHVEYFFDEEQRRIGFKFYDKAVSKDCYALGQRHNNFRSSATEVMNRYRWVNKTASSIYSEDRKFVSTKTQGMWTIQLSPSFEASVLRKFALSELPNESGIYRYVDENEKTVYIGKGHFKNRFSDPLRKDWIFHKIEYSIVNGEEAQFEWESFWIEKFKELSGGFLPYYNKISGHKN